MRPSLDEVAASIKAELGLLIKRMYAATELGRCVSTKVHSR